MENGVERKERDAKKIASSFWWTSFGLAFFTYFIIYVFLGFYNENTIELTEFLFWGIFKFFYTLARNALAGILLFVFSMIIAIIKIQKTTIIKKNQIKQIILKILLKFTVLNIICSICSAMISDIKKPTILDPLIVETLVIILFATCLLTSISEKE